MSMARILVTGSINRDRTLRLDGPLPACRVTARDMGFSLGGAASNTALALACAGHEVVIASACGAGPSGDAMLAQLAAGGVDVSRVARPVAPPAEPLILIEPGGERTIIHHMPGQGAMVDFADFANEDWDGIYAAMPAPGLSELCARHLQRAAILGQWYPATHAPPADVLVTSAAARPGAPQRLTDLEAPLPGWLVTTLGAEGARAVAANGATITLPAWPARPVDTTGAGDVYAAGLLHGMVAGWPIPAAMTLAAQLAAHHVETPGPTPSPSLSKIFSTFNPEECLP